MEHQQKHGRKKRKGCIAQIKNWLKNMRLRQRMLIVYLLGGILPLLFASLYTNAQIQKMMVDLTKETQTEELSLIGNSIQESMNVVANVIRLLADDHYISQMAKTAYTNKFDFLKDVTNFTTINDYLNYYNQDISQITIYLSNSSLERNVIESADNIAYLGDLVRMQDWYREAKALDNLEYWHYGQDANGNLCLQATSAVKDSNDDVIAVITVTMQHWKTVEAIDEREVDTFLLYNDRNIVYSNTESHSKYSFLADTLKDVTGISYTKKVVSGVEEYLMTYHPVKPLDSVNYYSLVSIQSYQKIMSDVNRISMKSLLPELICMVFSIVLIFGFSIVYDRRINKLRVQMHHVAQGEYEQVVPLGGEDEIGELYQELEQMMKDIQELMGRVVEEKVQKEKLHTRQKEVEFKMLASQINPHFLYNTLETIRMKAVVNHQSEIEELVKMLAKIMRYNIQVSDKMVPLKSELQMVEYYLKIQNYRFGDRIESEIRVDNNVRLDTPVMPLVMQPFVENAFIHGLEAKSSGGKLSIHVAAREEEGIIKIIISDNGVGMDYYRLGQVRKAMREENGDRLHIGIYNVNQRLCIQYGSEYGVQIESRPNQGTTVTICFPF